jgi:hypothetical protein
LPRLTYLGAQRHNVFTPPRASRVYAIPYAAVNAASFLFARQAKFQWAIDEIVNSDSKVKFEW